MLGNLGIAQRLWLMAGIAASLFFTAVVLGLSGMHGCDSN
jgi:hypothetical protein